MHMSSHKCLESLEAVVFGHKKMDGKPFIIKI